ncbi:polysaccharide biosynthesis C-terminal domain-containing protein, partial [Eudoraea sp.]
YGRSDLFLKLEVFKKSFLAIGIILGLQFGVIGLVWSSVIVSIISLLINTYYSSKLIHYTTKRQLLDMLPILLLASLTFLLMYYSVYLFIDYSDIVQIAFASLAGITFYLLINSFFKTSPLYDLLTIIKNRKL